MPPQLGEEARSELDRAALRAAMFAARAGGRWNLLPLPDPKEPLMLGKAFWARCRRHLFYGVCRTGLSSAFPELGRAGERFPAVAGRVPPS